MATITAPAVEPQAPTRRHRAPVVALLSAYGVSLVGTRLSMIALPLFVLETTGSPTRTGLVASRSVPSAVLVAVTDEDSRTASAAVAAELRARDVACEVAPSAAKFGKQIRFAERRGIPYVWFVQADGTSQVKDIRTGDQVEADPATWTPPEADLRPHIVSTVTSTPSTPEETP